MNTKAWLKILHLKSQKNYFSIKYWLHKILVNINYLFQVYFKKAHLKFSSEVSVEIEPPLRGPQAADSEAGDARLRRCRKEVKEWVHNNHFSLWLVDDQNCSGSPARAMAAPDSAGGRAVHGLAAPGGKIVYCWMWLLGFEINLNPTRFGSDPTWTNLLKKGKFHFKPLVIQTIIFWALKNYQ